MAEQDVPGSRQATDAALARYYDLDVADDPGDVELYLALAAATDGPILELAAGSGRVAVPLAAAGRDVVAVDRDPHMLERARARWATAAHPAGAGSLELVTADITSFRSERRFELVILALNSLLLFEREGEQPSVFESMARCLAPSGRAVLDCWLPAPEDLALYDGRMVLDWVRHDREAEEWVAKVTSARYAPAARVADITTFYDGWRDGSAPRRTMRRDRVSFLTPTEMVAAATAAGLQVELLAGDYDLNRLTDDADRAVMICRTGLI